MWVPPADSNPPRKTDPVTGPAEPPIDTGFAGESGPPVGWPTTGGSVESDPAVTSPPPAISPEPAPAAPTSTTSPEPRNPILSVTPTPAPVAGSGWTTVPTGGPMEIAPGLRIAGTGARFVALLIDLIIIGIAIGIVTSVLGMRTGLVTNASSLLLEGVISTVIGGLYFVVSWTGGRRATIGQRLLSIQVGHAFDGAALTLEQAIRRWLALGFFLSLFTVSTAASGVIGLVQLVWWLVLLVTTMGHPARQGLHDRFAETALVRPTAAGNGLVTACLVLVILFLVLVIAGMVGLIFIGGQISSIMDQGVTT